ncbi:MAG: hypothetical protein LUQ25_06355 [Methanoregulaceae archaeon]|nr:hypothetical protein [Methanoregulaceae archaeon]
MMTVQNTAQEEIKSEIKKMVKKQEFLDQKSEFSGMTGAYLEKTGRSEDDAWQAVTEKIVEVLPNYLTEGLLTCSLETISDQEACRKVIAEKRERKLTITPGSNFPRITFPTFYPYLELILRAGPVDLFRTKTTFMVEGSMYLKKATINFVEERVGSISGDIEVLVKISLCKGKFAAILHEFKKEIHVT